MQTKSWIWLGAIVLVILIAVAWVAGSYNGLVSSDENVNKAWANVQAAYQRRADLVPNLVATVQGAANFEKSTLLAVTEARTKWLDSQSGSVNDQMAAANELDGAIAHLLVTVEAYPDLKATQNFLSLQDQLEGTENRINVARQDYNTAVNDYNVKVRSLPTNILAGMFGFSAKTPFAAAATAQNAPTVAFS